MQSLNLLYFFSRESVRAGELENRRMRERGRAGQSLNLLYFFLKGERERGRGGEWDSGRVGEGESGRAEEWESGRVGEWERGRAEEWENGRGGERKSRASDRGI